VNQAAPTRTSLLIEVSPTTLRGVLTSCINIAFVTGQLIANGVIAGTSKLDSHWAYSGPFAAQWIWPFVILIGLPFAPERYEAHDVDFQHADEI
jgi:MFS transporter, SP family, general alpha glucoside:H+ symporter